jgi:hypothetical protein
VSWPVATSESSQARFEVTADAFQRRVNFGGISGELAVLYIGSSPGFRRVHARRDGADAVYSIDFGVHELPADRSEWLNKQLFRTEGISRVVLPQGEVLMMDDQGVWTLDGRATDAAVTGEYVDRIARLAVLGFADDAALDDLGDPQVLSVEDEQGSHALTFRFDEAEDQYVLTSDRMPGEYTVASYIVEQVLISADELEEVEPSEEMSLEEEASSTEGG